MTGGPRRLRRAEPAAAAPRGIPRHGRTSRSADRAAGRGGGPVAPPVPPLAPATILPGGPPLDRPPTAIGLIEAAAGPSLHAVAAATGQTAVLAFLRGKSVLVRTRVDPPPRPLHVRCARGDVLPPYAQAMVNVLLAWLDRPALALVLDGFAPGVPHASAPTVLALRLARVRETGHDVSSGGPTGEITCIAAPVRDARARVVAGLGILAPQVYVEEDLPELTVAVVRAAHDVTALLAGPAAARSRPLRGGEAGRAP